MWMLILQKYWKECLLLTVLMITLITFGLDEFFDERRETNLREEAAYCKIRSETCAKDYNDLVDALNLQNTEIAKWKSEAENRAEALEMALNYAPEVIYRDRIVEIPSIVTEPCEDVVVDIADYVAGVIDGG